MPFRIMNLSKNDKKGLWNRRPAVSDLTLEVSQGEIFGFLGPNGAGKTTTINILCTLLKPTAGQAKVNGHDVIKERSQVRQSIGLVFQEPALDDYLTAEQNLRFHGYAYGIPKNVLEPRLKELLEMMELWDDCMSFPNLHVRVKRHYFCTMNFVDENWESHTWFLENDLSELMQHEYDHLNGILATQRAIDNESFKYVGG